MLDVVIEHPYHIIPDEDATRIDCGLCDLWLLIIKTQGKRFDELEKKVKSLHSYSVPEIIALPIIAGSSSYLDWLAEMTEK